MFQAFWIQEQNIDGCTLWFNLQYFQIYNVV